MKSFDFGFVDAARSALIQQQNMDIISNNLANVNTTGFKGDRLVFSDLMKREMKSNFDQGSLRATDNTLDVAIAGDGFFRVQTPQGIRLTRDGAFRMQGDGTLVTSQGYQVMSDGGAPVTLNPNGGQVYIDEKGNIMQGLEQVGALGVVEAADLKTLVKEGTNLYGGEDGNAPATKPATNYTLSQGHIEVSNVEVVGEMVHMINAFRSFESYQKVLQTMQEMDTKTVNQVGRVA